MSGFSLAHNGLSPLARGNPNLRTPGLRPYKDYPRSRGGTHMDKEKMLMLQGLSPLARGNRRLYALGRARAGTIPARAGEPQTLAKQGH